MKLNKLCYLASVALAAFSVQIAFAAPPIPVGQTNYLWSGAGDGASWSDPANWNWQSYDAATNLYSGSGMVPATNGTTFQVFIGTGYPTTTPTPIVISASDVVRLNDSFYGPEWGETLDIYGSVVAGFGNFPLGDTVSGPSTINLYGNGRLTANDTISIGDTWWFPGGPNVNVNLRDNSQYTGNYLWLGGHLNLYGGIASVTNFMGAGGAATPVFTGGIDSDATRYVNLVGGKLILPTGFTSTVNDWINRGIFFAYGKKYHSEDLVITETDPTYTNRTVVSTVPLGGSLISVHLEVRPSMMVGTFQNAPLLGDYPNVTNVVLSYLDPTTTPTPTYQSSDTNVVAVSASGVLTAIKPGSSTIIGTLGTLSATNFVTVTPYVNNLVHRYSFNESGGTRTADSVGGASWDGTLYGGATLGGGQVTLDGSSGYVQLPAGVVSNMDAITIEAWADFSNVTNGADSYATLYAFGDQNPNTLYGRDYIAFQPWRTNGAPNASALFGAADPGSANEQDATLSLVNGSVTNHLGNVFVAIVYHPYAGYVSFYTNGVLAAINTGVSSPLAATLGADPLNYLGQSLYFTDPFLNASINEFRIYNGPLTAGQIAADNALGPNQLRGTNMSASLSVVPSGTNMVFSWSTNSALVDLWTSPILGSGASWTRVNGAYTMSGGNYQVTAPMSGTAQFFRLSSAQP